MFSTHFLNMFGIRVSPKFHFDIFSQSLVSLLHTCVEEYIAQILYVIQMRDTHQHNTRHAAQKTVTLNQYKTAFLWYSLDKAQISFNLESFITKFIEKYVSFVAL